MTSIDFEGFLDQEGPQAETPGAGPSPQLAVTRHRDVESAVRRLPALPALLQQLMRELRDVDADMRSLVDRISSDASLTTRVLKMANSPFYSPRSEVVAVGRAVMTLGFKTVANLVMAAGFRGAMTVAGPVPGFVSNGIFRHSLAAGVCCARLDAHLPRLREHRDELFVAGLLHDVGRIALVGLYRENASALQEMGRMEFTPEAEQMLLGVDHLDVGRMVMEHWGLPEELLSPLTRHHLPVDQLRDEPATLAVVAVDGWLNGRGFARTTDWKDRERIESAAEALLITASDLDSILEDFEDEVASFAGAAA